MTDALCHLVVDGNDVLEIKLVRSQKDIEDEDTSFGPEMCHQVFGENENIFGYQDLQIHLYYSAGSLLTYLGIEYTDKIEPSKSEGLTADDVEGALQKVLAPGYITNLDRFISMLDKDAHFTPHGRLVHSFTVTPDECGTKRTFEVYYNETSTPGFLQYHERLQTFLLWYVDAASFIDVDDDQWTFFTVFEKWQSSEGDWRYASAAYATAYRYYAYPKHTRPRVSQVLTLPPFRKMGICAHLLQAIYSHFTIQPDVIDITVEDPSQDFQRIRDYVDARNCAELPAFQPEKLANGFTTEMWQSARAQLKINKRQARRVYEILRLRATDISDAAAYRAYRLHVKNRLNAPHQKRKLEMKKLQKVLKPEEYAATISVAGASETHDRLKSQYLALEQEYRRVLDRWDRD
ncbi:histone acetyltransferase type B catalytic subunit [Plutella xylostella]|uniref:histone acetyltransferase type B catalytic subunit n=1 Tax=Plutella xylostella TaxID=51655 RepID=UPI002032C465|nr:histone acetyltransferase type B catalytic subunit [Plutella xylostella]